MHLFLIVGRIENSDNDYATALLAARDESDAQDMFEAQMTEGYDAEERAETKFEYDVSIQVGTYTGQGTLQIPEGCDWHLSTIYPGMSL